MEMSGYSNIFRDLKEPICLVDSQLRILAVTPALAQLTGLGIQELLSMNAVDIVTAEIGEQILVLQDVTVNSLQPSTLLESQRLETLGILASGIAHDIANLVTSIITGVSVARMYSAQGQDITDVLDDMDMACANVTSLLRQMLSIAKSEESIKKPTSVARTLHDSVSLALRGSNCRASLLAPEQTWPVLIDIVQLGQAIRNLIINADQAMPQGGVIDVRAENTEIDRSEPVPLEPGRYVRISIADQGIGIPQDHFAQIFDLHFTTKQRGSGLGLSIVRSIMKRHRGHVAVESQLGVGTTFHLYFRAAEDTHVEPKANPAREVIRGSERILVMDDQKMVRMQTSRELENMGYKVTVAKDGIEAIELFSKAQQAGRPFDLVILDLTVPGGMGGEETIKQLKALDLGVKAIIFSAYYDSPVFQRYREHGFAEALAKPYTMSALSRVVRLAIFADD